MERSDGAGMTRRQAIAATLGGAAAAAAIGAAAGSEASPPARPAEVDDPRAKATARMPVAFVPHGGGPWPFVELGFATRRETDALAGYLRALREVPPSRPRAMLVVSAHWEERVPTVMTSPRPPILYDYYGFPPAAYELTWPAPGDAVLAARVGELLGAAGIAHATDAARGFDHGTFIPFKVTYPDAEVPTVQLSLKGSLDPAEHLAIGRALAPLRDEGVFVVGSGMSFHNLRAFGPKGRGASEAFDAWLREAATAPAGARDRQLEAWASAPEARAAHPREEHLLPLMVIAGAAGSDVGRTTYNDLFAGVRLSAFHFG
jgi:aromatic ring-opening dioxygenase catalytic subunit (LigB family)